jgi:probable phosphoglycerate mutase
LPPALSRCAPIEAGKETSGGGRNTADRGLPEIWLVRHGETEWTRSRRHTGTTDIALTERGRRQARALVPSFDGVHFDLVLSSPMQRAEETARLVGLEPRADDRLREWNYGEYEGRTTAEIHRERPGWDLWRDGCPGGERADDVGVRLEPLLQELRERADGRLVLFGHSHCFRVLAGCWLELGAEAGRALTIGTASLSVLAVEHGRPVIAHWNALPLERAPTPETTLDATRQR